MIAAPYIVYAHSAISRIVLKETERNEADGAKHDDEQARVEQDLTVGGARD